MDVRTQAMRINFEIIYGCKLVADGAKLYAVVNDLGYVTCTQDGGKTAHHVGLWTSMEAAERHAAVMLRLNSGTYQIVEVSLCQK